MRIELPNDCELLTGVKHGRDWALSQDPDVAVNVVLVVTNKSTLITRSWFNGVLQTYTSLGVNVELEGGGIEVRQEFDAAVKYVSELNDSVRQNNALLNAAAELKKKFECDADFKRSLIDPTEVEFNLMDFFTAKKSKDGLLELEDDDDRNFHHRKFNKAKLAAIIVNLITIAAD